MKRFALLSKEGVLLPEGADFGDVGAIQHVATGLLIAPFLANAGEPATTQRAREAAAEVELFGKPCRLPEVEEGFLIPDRSKYDPALDPAIFPFLVEAYKEHGRWRLWTNTACAWSGDYAWYVPLYDGYSLVSRQNGKGLVLAVRGGPASPPSQ